MEIPSRYTPETRIVPTVDEVAPWVEALVRLWDDEELYSRLSEQVRYRAKLWGPEQVGPIYREFFSGPGAPLVPRGLLP